MQNKIAGFAVIMLMVWYNGHHVPHVMAFFDYNTFHPMPFRPDLQEYCPQVSAIPMRARKITCCTRIHA